MERNMTSFEKALTKGEIGESIVRQHLEDKGWVVYFPFTKDRPHYFDMLATYRKQKAVAIDVKTKARLNAFPGQGIDRRHYDEYMVFVRETNVPFWLVFVDEMSGDIHAAELTTLHHPVELCGGKILAWPLSQMKLIAKLSQSQQQEIQRYNQRNHDWNPAC